MNSSHRASGSDDEQSSNSRKRKTYNRHSQHQTQQLEAFFNELPHPDEKQRKQLSREIGLSPLQIKFWFQNKRTQIKTINERSDNNVLRAENDRFRCENNVMLETLKNIECLACRKGSCHGHLQNQPQRLRTLRTENVRLREEHGGAIHFENFSNSTLGNNYIPDAHQLIPEMTPSTTDRASIIKMAVSAMNELIELLHVNEPIWTISPTDGRSSLHRDNYNKLFPKPNHFKSANARIESSKYSAEVAIPGPQLLEAFLDPMKRMDMFPTIVTKAKTFEVVDTVKMFRSSSIHLMYEKMHIMSPLVAPREFFFSRHVKHIAPLTWVIADVSYDIFKHLQHAAAPTRCWKLPSGCMIQDKSNGKSLVTWIEHVEVDDKSLTHRMYRDLICYAYGSKRWVTTLQRMCDRVACSLGLTTTPVHELEGVIHLPEARRNVMRLSHRMVKSLCQILNMSDRLDFPHFSELSNTGVRVSVRICRGIGQPNGLIVAAATSIALPISTHDLFHFLNDETRRPQWDILSSGNPVNAIARISTGTNPGNCISILQPFIPKENLLMLQETNIDSLGASLVYAPIVLPSITSAMDGETERIQILPSGFLISHDGKTWKGANGTSKSGSILTIALQILACHISKSQPKNMESVATVHSFISSTVQRIKIALGCPDLD